MSGATIVFASSPASTLLTLACAAAEQRLRERGHEVTVLDLAAFDPVMSRDERAAYHSERPLISPATTAAAQAVQTSRVLVFVYPTVLFALPPVVKGWLDRVLVPGVAFSMAPAGRTHRGLRHIDRLVGVSSYDTSRWATRRAGDSGRRILARNLRACTRLTTRVRWVGLYADGGATPPSEPFLELVRRAVAP